MTITNDHLQTAKVAQATGQPRSSDRLPALDGLRAIAIALVLIQHAVPGLSGDQLSWRSPGADGVLLFFVLSGFLITGVLETARASAEAAGASMRSVWWSFYVRRALRIAPAAYAAIVLAAALGASHGIAWFATYLGNFYVARTTGADTLSHFWSLAIEEQFYLVWPIVMLALPRRWQPAAMWTVIVAAVAIRGAYLSNGLERAAGVLPWTRMDALAAGGLLATRPARPIAPITWCIVLTGAAWSTHGWLARTLEQSACVAAAGAIVITVASGRVTTLSWLLSARPLVYLGTISYGLYVWHPFILMPAIGIGGASDHAVLAEAAGTALAVATAGASWRWLERPFNEMKRFVPYLPAPTRPSSD